MIYRAPEGRLLWDSWLYPWEGTNHLFYLDTTEEMGKWGQIGHAVSRDLLNWTDCEPIRPRGAPGEWDHGPLMTGMVVRYNSRFWMPYGSWRVCGSRAHQAYGMLISDDLYHWEKLPENPVIVPKAPYLEEPRGPFIDTGWSDPYITWREDLQIFEAVVTAKLASYNVNDLGSCIGRVRSGDLIHWEMAPPLVCLGRHFTMCEIPQYFELEGRHYLIFGSTPHNGRQINTPSRNDCSGTFYVVADDRDGPYRLPADPLLIGAGSYRIDSYSGRTVAAGGTGSLLPVKFSGAQHGLQATRGTHRLFYHIIDAFPAHAFGTPKVVAATPCGDLFLRRWPGLDGLREKPLVQSFDTALIEPENAKGIARWSVAADRGHRLSGVSPVACSVVELPVFVGDFELCCNVELSAGGRATIVFRSESGRPHGTGLALDAGRGTAEVVHLIPSSPGPMSFPVDRARWILDPVRPVEVRIMARSDFVEVYLDDRWAFTTVTANKPDRGDIVPQPYGSGAAGKHAMAFPVPGLRIETGEGHAPRDGHLGFGVEGGEAVFSDLTVHAIRPLD